MSLLSFSATVAILLPLCCCSLSLSLALFLYTPCFFLFLYLCEICCLPVSKPVRTVGHVVCACFVTLRFLAVSPSLFVSPNVSHDFTASLSIFSKPRPVLPICSALGAFLVRLNLFAIAETRKPFPLCDLSQPIAPSFATHLAQDRGAFSEPQPLCSCRVQTPSLDSFLPTFWALHNLCGLRLAPAS